jgi:hypothetical protein
VLAERLSRRFGREVGTSVLPYDRRLHAEGFAARSRLRPLIGCVDTAAARRAMARDVVGDQPASRDGYRRMCADGCLGLTIPVFQLWESFVWARRPKAPRDAYLADAARQAVHNGRLGVASAGRGHRLGAHATLPGTGPGRGLRWCLRGARKGAGNRDGPHAGAGARADAIAERVVSTLRTDCLGHLIPLHEAHLRTTRTSGRCSPRTWPTPSRSAPTGACFWSHPGRARQPRAAPSGPGRSRRPAPPVPAGRLIRQGPFALLHRRTAVAPTRARRLSPTSRPESKAAKR